MAIPADLLTAKGRRTRGHILTVAAGLLLDRGVDRTTMEQICLAAGVSASQLYHYFDNKRDLLEAVIRHQTEVILANELLATMASCDDLQRWRDAVVTATARLGARAGCPLASFGEQIRDTDRELRVLVADGLRRLTAAVAERLDVMRGTGELRADADTARLAVLIVTAYEGGLLVSQIQRNTAALEVALDNAVATVVAHRT